MVIRNRPPVCLTLALGLLVMLSHRGYAQHAIRSNGASEGCAPPECIRGGWVSGAAGLDAEGSKFVGSVGVHLQRNGVVISGRKDTRGPGDPDVVDAIGMLIGVASTRRWSSAVISAGLSSVDARGYFDRRLGAHRHALGMTMAGEVALRAGRRAGVGLGLTGFAHLNSVGSFAGVALELSAGRWR